MPLPLRRPLFGFALIVVALAPLQRVVAQDAFTPASAKHLRDEYMADLDTVHVKIMALANAIPADKYTWRPAPGVRSISQVLMHVSSEWYYFVPGSVGGKPPADFGNPKDAEARLDKIVTKKEVIDQLTKSWAYSKAQLLAAEPAKMTGVYKPWGTTLDGAAFGMAGDMHEHLGQLISYARMNGVKPPWSK
ncbi:MAG: DinB family protein [bacterium]